MLIIKELFDYSDNEIVENLMLDLHLQYALHTTSFAEQPISDKTLSRMELIYTCISKLVVYLTKKQPDMVSEPLKHYADPNDYNRIFYHQRNDGMETMIQTLLADSDCLPELCKTDFEEATEYQLFVRCLSDQTVVENDKRRLKTREDGTRLLKCAAGHEPVSQSYTKATRQCRVSFDRNHCVGCPYQDQCRPKIHKKVATFITSKNASNRAKSQRYMQSEEFGNLARLRNGVETIPANIRKNYHLDKLPRGKQRGKFFFGSKIAALNFRKLFGFRKGLGNYAQNPVLA